jgi:NAD(P)-dependent dehydrogenase (short-subunit alcohol dehydrogenase family)
MSERSGTPAGEAGPAATSEGRAAADPATADRAAADLAAAARLAAPATRDLDDLVAIVTGAGKGLGRAYAIELARRGAAVIVNNRRHPGEADADTSASRTAAAIVAAGGRARPNWDDVTDPASGARLLAQALAAYGRLDIAVANAGVAAAAAFHKTTPEEFRRVFDTSFFGNLHLAHAVWPHFRTQRRGVLTLTASSAGLYGVHGMAAYSSAKAAVIGLMRALAIEGGPQGIRVNVVAPYGYSQMTAQWMDDELARRFDPARVAPLIAALARPDCRVHGEVLLCGGGVLRRAQAGENRGVALPQADLQKALDLLKANPVETFGDANAEFSAMRGDAVALQPGR